MKAYSFSKISVSNTFTIVLVLLVNVLLLLLAMQGFDVTDEGFYFTFYQQIFNNPSSVEYSFVYYNTGIIGGLWYWLFSTKTILAFRVLTIVCLNIIGLIIFKILKKTIPFKFIILGIIASIFALEFSHTAFSYNHLSSLLLIIAIYFCLNGLHKNKLIFIVIAGCITAINIFTRLPNIVLISIAFIYPIQQFLNPSYQKNVWIKQTLSFFAGFILGLGVMFILISSLGHKQIMESAILSIFSKGKGSSDSHNISKLFYFYLKHYYSVLKYFFKFVLIIAISYPIYNYVKKSVILKGAWLIMLTSAFIYVFLERTVPAIYAVCLPFLIMIIFSSADYKLKNISLMAIFMLVCLPVGSDGGILAVGYMCLWLALPITIFAIYNLNIFSFLKTINTNDDVKPYSNVIVICFFTGFFIISFYNLWNRSYSDYGSRLYKTYTINSKLAEGVYTTKERASVINEVLPQLKKHVKKDDYLFAYDKVPMLNFLTKTKPYIYNSWVWIYNEELFYKQLQRAENEIENLPVVIIQKFESVGRFHKPIDDYMSETKKNDYLYNSNRTKHMNDFLERHNYKIVWSNDYFSIYKSIL